MDRLRSLEIARTVAEQARLVRAAHALSFSTRGVAQALEDLEQMLGARRLPHASHPASYQLRFQPLGGERRSMAFPCDAEGHVDLDALPDRVRNDYFYARTVIGREYARPAVQLDD